MIGGKLKIILPECLVKISDRTQLKTMLFRELCQRLVLCRSRLHITFLRLLRRHIRRRLNFTLDRCFAQLFAALHLVADDGLNNCVSLLFRLDTDRILLF